MPRNKKTCAGTGRNSIGGGSLCLSQVQEFRLEGRGYATVEAREPRGGVKGGACRERTRQVTRNHSLDGLMQK